MVGRLDLLRRRFVRVVIPQAVACELTALAHDRGKAAIEEALRDGWLVIEAVPDRRLLPVLATRVDEGEAEAIELARQTRADLLLIDDLDGRRVGAEESLPYTGLLGVLAAERLAGNIRSLREEIQRLTGSLDTRTVPNNTPENGSWTGLVGLRSPEEALYSPAHQKRRNAENAQGGDRWLRHDGQREAVEWNQKVRIATSGHSSSSKEVASDEIADLKTTGFGHIKVG